MSLEVHNDHFKNGLPYTHEKPFHAYGFVELRGDGWTQVEHQLHISQGVALILIHPWYHIEQQVNTYFAGSSNIQPADSHTPDYAHAHINRFNEYARSMTKTIRHFTEQKIPVINLFDTPSLNKKQIWKREHAKLDDMVREYRNMFTSFGLPEHTPMFYVPTTSFAPYPLGDSESEASEVKTYAFIHALTQHKLHHAILGGGYFGGGKNGTQPIYGRRDSYRLDDYPITADSTQGEILQYLQINGCAGLFMDFLKKSGVNFSVGEAITYPQHVPKPDELIPEGWSVRWTRGFEHIHAI